MCGILVVYSKRSALDARVCQRALDKLKLRGPDFSYSDSFFGDRLFLGNTVLSIVGDPVPVIYDYHRSASRRFELVYNGEIYNYADLFQRHLAGRGYRNPSDTDTETLVNLHEVASPAKVYDGLRGMFAYVVYDSQQNRLLIGRDLIGEKILYVYENQDFLIVSSEVAPILEIVPSIRLNRDVLREYFFTRHLLCPRDTVFEGVHLIPPGTLLEYDLAQCTFQTLFAKKPADLIDPEAIERRRRCTLDEVSDEFEAILAHIGLYLAPASARYAAVVSGGVDSSLSSLALTENGAAPTSYISLQFPGKDKPSEDLRGLERRLGRSVHKTEVDVEMFGAYLAECYGAACSPLPTHSFISQEILSRHARLTGAKVMVGGDGGDELFGGYELYKRLATQSEFPNTNPSVYSGFVPLGFEFEGWSPDCLVQRVQDRWREYAAYYQCCHDPRERMVQTVLYSDTVIQCESVGIRAADTMSMLNSVEGRCFYLTRESMEFALNLPGNFKIDLAAPDGAMVTRPLLKTVFLRKFGSALLHPKQGFSGYPNEAGRRLVDSSYPLVRQALGLRRIPGDPNGLGQAIEWKLINAELFLGHFRRHL
jgi:asparagine synthase (glutamine-hydrolysing)